MNFCANCGISPSLVPSAPKFTSMVDQIFPTVTLGQVLSNMYGPSMTQFLSGIPGGMVCLCSDCVDIVKRGYVPWSELTTKAKWPGIFSGLFVTLKHNAIVTSGGMPLGSSSTMTTNGGLSVGIDSSSPLMATNHIKVEPVVDVSFEQGQDNNLLTPTAAKRATGPTTGFAFSLSLPMTRSKNRVGTASESDKTPVVAIEKEKYQCPICPFSKKWASNLIAHMKKIHVGQRVSTKQRRGLSFTADSHSSRMRRRHRLKCSVCPFACEFQASFVHHLETRHLTRHKTKTATNRIPSSNSQCALCLKGFVNHPNRNCHYQQIHKLKKEIECFTCKAAFYTEHDLKVHGAKMSHIVHEGEENPPSPPTPLPTRVESTTPGEGNGQQKNPKKKKSKKPITEDCPLCNHPFATRNKVAKHLQAFHKLSDEDLDEIFYDPSQSAKTKPSVGSRESVDILDIDLIDRNNEETEHEIVETEECMGMEVEIDNDNYVSNTVPEEVTIKVEPQ